MSSAQLQVNAALPILRCVEVLSGAAVQGMSNKDLAGALHTSPANVTRYLATLAEAGWARKDDATGRFHPTAHVAQLFGRVMHDFARAEQRLSDLKTSFTRTPS